MSEKFSFVPATESDLAELTVLVNSAYRGESSKKGWTTEADLLDGQRTDPEGLRSMITAPGSIILLAKQKSKILGCVFLKNENQKCYLGMLTVNPSLQNQGTGKSILKNAETFALKSWNLEVMQMKVLSIRGELISWYERHGYSRTGKTDKFPYGDERFGIPKRPDLEFIIFEKKLKL